MDYIIDLVEFMSNSKFRWPR